MSRGLPHHIFSSQEVKAIESLYAKDHHGSCFDLMQRAGRAVVDEILKLNMQDCNVWIFVGRGNNGGDGYIVASLLDEQHVQYRLFSLGEPHEGTEAYLAYQYYLSIGGKIEYSLPNFDENPPDIIVDALLGTGLNSAPRSPFDDWILFINRMHAYTISVDVPSGLNADTGVVVGDCVKADLCVCMLALKAGLLTSDAVDYTGKIIFNDLGFKVNNYWGSKSPMVSSTLPVMRKDYEAIIEDLPVRMRSAHKGDSGKVLVIGGQEGMGGAINICANAALRTGAGLVKAATHHNNVSALNAHRPEIMTVNFTDLNVMQQAIDFADVIAIGPGLSVDDNAVALLSLIKDTQKVVIYDADALNVIAKTSCQIAKRCVLTPHPMECARLLHINIEKVQENRLLATTLLQQKFGGVALLKGAGTIVCDGKFLTIINEGSPAMASGGMGDLLTGMIAALVAQGLSVRDAVISAACIHGKAGYLAGRDHGVIGTIASDLLPYVHKLVNGNQDA